MGLRFVTLAAATLLLAAFTQADLEKTRKAKDYFKDNYWKCLATEIVQKQPTNISVQEFSLHIKGICRKEKDEFFGTLIKYMTMLHPELANNYSLLSSAANVAVSSAINDAVKVFVDLRSGKKDK